MHQTHRLRTDAHVLTSPLPARSARHIPLPQAERPPEVLTVSQCQRPEGESPRTLDLGLTTWLLPALLLSRLYLPSMN